MGEKIELSTFSSLVHLLNHSEPGGNVIINSINSFGLPEKKELKELCMLCGKKKRLS